MSGNAGIRGYLLQTIICLLDALQSDDRWELVTLEPNLDADKVDIIWYYPESKSKVTQVKSSQNQIQRSDAEGWARELETSIQATSYALVLIGPCSQGVIDLGKVGKVEIPTPRPLDIDGLISQSAHKLSKFCEEVSLPPVNAVSRELLVQALVTKLESYSTTGSPLSRVKLEQVLKVWIDNIRAQAFSVPSWENPTRLTLIGQDNNPNISIQAREVQGSLTRVTSSIFQSQANREYHEYIREANLAALRILVWGPWVVRKSMPS